MDGNRLCIPEWVFYCPLSFKILRRLLRYRQVFLRGCPSINFANRTLKIFPRFFFHLDKFFFRLFSKYIDLKIRKFLTVNIWENFNYFYEISVFSDMEDFRALRYMQVIFIAYNLIYNNSRPTSLREFLQLWKICNNHLPWLNNILNLKNHFTSAWLSRNILFCSLKTPLSIDYYII